MSELEQAKNEPAERWNPSNGELYKSILSDAGILESPFVEGNPHDQNRIRFGNAFPTYMPLDDVIMSHQFINEMELIRWQLGISSSNGMLAYVIQSKCGKICYRFDSIAQKSNVYFMLSYKVKDWLKMEISSLV